MPSAANGKTEKSASSEAADNSPIRQFMVLVEHKIRNLEKRKGKLISYRDLQKSGKELNADQKVAVAKYDEVAQTLEFARDLWKQMTSIATVAEREAKKQAKKEAWVRAATETAKIRETLLILDCLMQMGHSPAREDFLNGTNGAAKLTEADLKILDDLYPEVTPKHELNEEGVPGFHTHSTKAAEHLYCIIDGKPKEILGTTYTHIKEIVTTVHQCGYFDKAPESEEPELIEEETQTPLQLDVVEEPIEREQMVPPQVAPVPAQVPTYIPPLSLGMQEPVPVPPAPSVVPAPAYPLRPMPPITLQEVEHAYFSQQYPQQRITDVIGSQNFYFLQESEIDSPVGTPQPPQILSQPSPPMPIPTQTFTNQNFVAMPAARVPPEATALPIPQAHFVPAGTEHQYQPLPPRSVPVPLATVERHVQQVLHHAPLPPVDPAPLAEESPTPTVPSPTAPAPIALDNGDEWTESPERDQEPDQAKSQGQGDGQGRFRRYGRGQRGAPNGYRGRGGYRQNNEGYQGRQGSDNYQGRQGNDNYQGRQVNDNYQGRQNNDGYRRPYNDYYNRNGDNQQGEGGERQRDRYDNSQGYQGGFKGRGRGGPRGGAPRPAGGTRPHPPHFARKQAQNAE